MVSAKRMILLAKISAKHLISQNTPNPFQAHFLSPLLSSFSLAMAAAPPSPIRVFSGHFPATLRQGFQSSTTSLHELSSSTLKITKYHLHLHLFQAQSK